jgi:transcriptional regulator/cytoskeletal protein CcmA (bactofilin family)
MANVKITDLTAIAAADVASSDVFVVVDVNADATKKITTENLTTALAAANDYVTYTQLNANLNTTTANVTAVETRRTNNIAGAISTVLTSDLTASRAMVTNGSGKIAVSDVTSTELGYVDGVTSAIQTQIDTKIATTTSASNDYVTYTRLNANLNTTTSNVTALETRRTNNIAGAISSVLTSDLTASRAMVSDGSGKIAVLSGVTSTELGYVDATSSIQTQLDAKAALAGATFTGQVNFNDDAVVTGNLTVNGDTVTANAVNLIVQDQFIALSNGGTNSMDVGIFYNRGTSGNAAIWYDASAYGFYLSETRDPFSNTTISPTGVANLTMGVLTASELDISGDVDVDGTLETDALSINGTAISATGTELNYVDGVTSAIQTQFSGAETRRTNNIAGAVSTVTTSDLTADRAVISNGSGKLAVSAVTSTEIGYLDGVTSSIQTQIDAAQATFSNTYYVTTTSNSYNIGTTVANINETDIYLDGVYQIKNQYVMANSSHNVQFKEATFTAGVDLEIVAHT